MLLYLAYFMATSFLFLGFNINLFGIIFIFCIYLLRGLVTPVLRNAINENTSSNKRATVLSIRSFFIRISFAIFAPLFGFLADNYSLNIAFYTIAIIVGFFSILAAIHINRLDNKVSFVS